MAQRLPVGDVLEGSALKQLHAYSAHQIANRLLPGPSAVIRMADDLSDLPPIKDAENAVLRLDLAFADTDDGPKQDQAKKIWQFVERAEASMGIEHIVAQCMAGVGRSVATCMAISRIHDSPWPFKQVHNRALYRMLLAEKGLAPEPEPSVSIALRVKYELPCLMTFLLSLQRQRYDNWSAVAFTDGLRPDVRQLLESMPGSKVTLMENSEPKGRWGHPYRQAALDLCEGDWIGTNNDDNYLTPGYIEQMVRAGEESGVPLVICGSSHRYSAWGPCKAGQDLSCWLARKELVRQVKWDTTDFWADQFYLHKLMDAAGGKVAEVPRMLVVKN